MCELSKQGEKLPLLEASVYASAEKDTVTWDVSLTYACQVGKKKPTTRKISPVKVLKKLDPKITINLSHSIYPLLERTAEEMDWRISRKNMSTSPWDILWHDTCIHDNSVLSGLKIYQKINHFPSMTQICRKTFLARNLNKMRLLFPDHYNFYPRSWILP